MNTFFTFFVFFSNLYFLPFLLHYSFTEGFAVFKLVDLLSKPSFLFAALFKLCLGFGEFASLIR